MNFRPKNRKLIINSKIENLKFQKLNFEIENEINEMAGRVTDPDSIRVKTQVRRTELKMHPQFCDPLKIQNGVSQETYIDWKMHGSVWNAERLNCSYSGYSDSK